MTPMDMTRATKSYGSWAAGWFGSLVGDKLIVAAEKNLLSCFPARRRPRSSTTSSIYGQSSNSAHFVHASPIGAKCLGDPTDATRPVGDGLIPVTPCAGSLRAVTPPLSLSQ